MEYPHKRCSTLCRWFLQLLTVSCSNGFFRWIGDTAERAEKYIMSSSFYNQSNVWIIMILISISPQQHSQATIHHFTQNLIPMLHHHRAVWRRSHLCFSSKKHQHIHKSEHTSQTVLPAMISIYVWNSFSVGQLLCCVHPLQLDNSQDTEVFAPWHSQLCFSVLR